MFEGEEIKGPIGKIGGYLVDVSPEMKLKVSVGVEIDLIAELKKLAAKSDTLVDDNAIAWIEKVLRPAAPVPPAA